MAIGRGSLFGSSNNPERKDSLERGSPSEEGNGVVDSEKQTGERRKSVASMSDIESGTSVGKQIEMEADNAIKYRTCSWQKVYLHQINSGSETALRLYSL